MRVVLCLFAKINGQMVQLIFTNSAEFVFFLFEIVAVVS